MPKKTRPNRKANLQLCRTNPRSAVPPVFEAISTSELAASIIHDDNVRAAQVAQAGTGPTAKLPEWNWRRAAVANPNAAWGATPKEAIPAPELVQAPIRRTRPCRLTTAEKELCAHKDLGDTPAKPPEPVSAEETSELKDFAIELSRFLGAWATTHNL